MNLPRPNTSSNRGFTLIELLIVLVIIGILTTIGLGNFRSARTKARDARRKHDLESVAKSLEAYFNDHKEYPESNAKGEIECKDNEVICVWGQAFTDDNGTVYSAKLPIDPTNYDYIYVPSANQSSYSLHTHIENSNDPAIEVVAVVCKDGSSCTIGSDEDDCCNYTLTSGN